MTAPWRVASGRRGIIQGAKLQKNKQCVRTLYINIVKTYHYSVFPPILWAEKSEPEGIEASWFADDCRGAGLCADSPMCQLLGVSGCHLELKDAALHDLLLCETECGESLAVEAYGLDEDVRGGEVAGGDGEIVGLNCTIPSGIVGPGNVLPAREPVLSACVPMKGLTYCVWSSACVAVVRRARRATPNPLKGGLMNE